LATPELYRTVGDLLLKEASGRGDGAIPTMAIVSAKGGMTDLLVKVVDSALLDFEQARIALEEAVESQIIVLKELAPPSITDPIEESFRQDGEDILSVVQSLRMIQTVPAVTMEVVTGFGEIWSAQTLNAYLMGLDVPCDWIDAREILVVKSDSSGLGEKGAASTGGVTPLYDLTTQRMEQWWKTRGKEAGFHDLDYSVESPVVVVTGFVATTAEGVPTTLKRSGSDYSATIFAKLTDAARVTMWKNTNGVYTADPRRVPEAFPIESLKYDEAMELAYFGAQVLHPSAMEPCIDKSIPVYVRNIFNQAFPGTVIQGRSATLKDVNTQQKVKNWKSKSGEIPIKGITSVDKTALVTLEGASAGSNVAGRFMNAMDRSGINVLIITQASSEYSITVAVPENEGQKAIDALEDAFELELSRSTINSLSLVTGMAIVAIVGEGMALTSGVSATFMSSLANANVNIRLIAQGSSERQVAVVVSADDASRALRAAHMAFTLSATTASIAVLGSTGDIGSVLMKQIQGREKCLLKDLNVQLIMTCAANSRKMVIAKDINGLDMDKLSDLLVDDETCTTTDNFLCDADMNKVTEIMEQDVNPNRVIIDCTNNEAVAEFYEEWLSKGINIISPSPNAAAGDLTRFKSICEAQALSGANWQYESSVGSALPIITTIRDLYETGDTIYRIQGCVSGTMAFILSTLSEDISFSEAVKMSVEKGYAEADPRVDIAGIDAGRKMVILARNLGINVNLEDVQVESLIPQEIVDKVYANTDRDTITTGVLRDIKVVDALYHQKVLDAKKDDCVLRYKFSIEKSSGKCTCGIVAVPRTDPLFRLKENENLVAFETERYATSPLIVKGAAAGPDLCASGIFADLLRLTRASAANSS